LDVLSFLDFLVEPTFIDRNNPPVKVSAKVIGWIAVVLSAFAVVLLLLVGIGAVFVIGGGHPGIFIVALIGLVLVVISWLLALLGGWQMTRGDHKGRRLLIQALVLAVISSFIYNLGLSNLGRFVLQLIINGVFYYFVVISRFPDEAASTAGKAMAGPPPGSRPQSPAG